MIDAGCVRAVSDLHVSYGENRDLVHRIRPEHPDDWLIVAGDVGELLADVESTLGELREHFAKVIWAPGNHELWTVRAERDGPRGVARYERLVELARSLDVVTPEDEYPVWTGRGGPVRIAPLFLLYDYSFLTPGTSTVEASFARAQQAGVICTDEYHLHHDPYPSRAAWCADRVAHSRKRLDAVAGEHPFVLVTHWPLVRTPCDVLRFPEFAQWCGTTLTADWHRRYDVMAAVYGHLHIPRRTEYDGVPFIEVSIGYPREWKQYGLREQLAQQIVPLP